MLPRATQTNIHQYQDPLQIERFEIEQPALIQCSFEGRHLHNLK